MKTLPIIFLVALSLACASKQQGQREQQRQAQERERQLQRQLRDAQRDTQDEQRRSDLELGRQQIRHGRKTDQLEREVQREKARAAGPGRKRTEQTRGITYRNLKIEKPALGPKFRILPTSGRPQEATSFTSLRTAPPKRYRGFQNQTPAPVASPGGLFLRRFHRKQY